MTRRAIPGLLASCIVAWALSACGGGGSATSGSASTATSSSDSPAAIAAAFGEHPGSHAGKDTVAKVGALTISRPYLSLWMTIELAEDYYSAFKRKLPDGLVSEPANYQECIATLKRLAAAGKANAAQLKRKCEQLHEAVKTQALSFLIASDWLFNFDNQHGMNATQQEASQALSQLRRARSETPAQFEASLLVRRRDRGQELYLAQIKLLESKLNRRIQSEGKHAKLVSEASSSTNTAICRAEYVVRGCREFKGRGYLGPAPGALLREVVR
jgi:hypothetical protein